MPAQLRDVKTRPRKFACALASSTLAEARATIEAWRQLQCFRAALVARPTHAQRVRRRYPQRTYIALTIGITMGLTSVTERRERLPAFSIRIFRGAAKMQPSRLLIPRRRVTSPQDYQSIPWC